MSRWLKANYKREAEYHSGWIDKDGNEIPAMFYDARNEILYKSKKHFDEKLDGIPVKASDIDEYMKKNHLYMPEDEDSVVFDNNGDLIGGYIDRVVTIPTPRALDSLLRNNTYNTNYGYFLLRVNEAIKEGDAYGLLAFRIVPKEEKNLVTKLIDIIISEDPTGEKSFKLLEFGDIKENDGEWYDKLYKHAKDKGYFKPYDYNEDDGGYIVDAGDVEDVD